MQDNNFNRNLSKSLHKMSSTDTYYPNSSQNSDFYHELSLSMNKISIFNSYDAGPFHLDVLDKLNKMIDCGYIPISDIELILSKTALLLSTINKKCKEINNEIYPSLCEIGWALDHLGIYIDESVFGAIALVSKSHYDMFTLKYGVEKTRIFILKHYIDTPIYSKSYVNIQSKYLDEIINHKISLSSIAKKNLRKIIGPKLYFDSYSDLFFSSDLAYLGQLHEEGICTKLILPRTICVFCNEIKSRENMHSDCYNIYHAEHFSEMIGSNKITHRDSDKCLQNFILMDQCDCKRVKKDIYCYLCPELIELVRMHYIKYFKMDTTFDAKLVTCTERGRNCKCKYYKINSSGKAILDTHELTNGIHNMNWDIYNSMIYKKLIPNLSGTGHTCGNKPRINILQPSNGCKACDMESVCNNFVIPITSLHSVISIHTPCSICSKPKFLHGFYSK